MLVSTILENLLNCEPESALSGAVVVPSGAGSSGFVASDSFMPPGFRPLFAASPPTGIFGVKERGLPPAGDADWKVGAFARLIPGGNLRPGILPPGELGLLLSGPPTGLLEVCMLPVETGWFPGKPGRNPCREGGAPCLERENAFIFACMSDVKPLALDAGTGLRAALTGPSGADEALMPGAEESLGLRSEGGFGDSSGDVLRSGCPSSALVIGSCDGVFAVGFSIVYCGPEAAAKAHGSCLRFASRERDREHW